MYIGNNLSTGRSETYVKTASGSETSVTTSDDGRLINYTVGWVKVWLNGVLLVNGTDYTATSGSSITGLSALTANDILTIEATHTFSSSDAVPATGGTFTGPVTFEGTTTTIESVTLTVDDKNIEMGSVDSPTDTTADGGGITLKGTTDKTFLWEKDTKQWNVNQKWTENAGSSFAHRPLTAQLILS